jgi:regulator of protease activity HflC (stomatin/prohibitin superfamily)
VKRAQWITLLCFVLMGAIAGTMLIGGLRYQATGFWVGMLVALAQCAQLGIAWWGLRTSSQQQDYAQTEAPHDGPQAAGVGMIPAAGFRMSYAADIAPPAVVAEPGTTTAAMEISFQRVVALLNAGFTLLLALVGAWVVWSAFANVEAGKELPISGTPLDELSVVLAVGTAGLYVGLHYYARIRRQTEFFGEAARSVLSYNWLGMVLLGTALVMGWLKFNYVGELAGVVALTLLFLQGLELIVGAIRDYTVVEESDQEPIDLDVTPLFPMITSTWLAGLRMVLVHSVGLAGQGDDDGVIARLMPRVLVAGAVVALLLTCVHVVPSGEVAIRERLGYATEQEISEPLAAGLHFTLPWPIDTLVRIPVTRVREETLGRDFAQDKDRLNRIQDAFWTTRALAPEEEYATGDREPRTGGAAPQLLGVRARVLWQVRDPGAYYRHLTAREFVEAARPGAAAYVRPTAEAVVQRITRTALMRALAELTLQDLLGRERSEVVTALRTKLQERLDALDIGVQIDQVILRDVYPPIGFMPRELANGTELGPAHAFADVVIKREKMDEVINDARAEATGKLNRTTGDVASLMADAQTYATTRLNVAQGEAQRIVALSRAFARDPELARYRMSTPIMEQMLPDVNKLILGRGVTPPDVWQLEKDGSFIPGQPMAAPRP